MVRFGFACGGGKGSSGGRARGGSRVGRALRNLANRFRRR